MRNCYHLTFTAASVALGIYLVVPLMCSLNGWCIWAAGCRGSVRAALELCILLTGKMCAQAHVCNYFPFIAGKVHVVGCGHAWKTWILTAVPSGSCGCVVLVHKMGWEVVRSIVFNCVFWVLNTMALNNFFQKIRVQYCLEVDCTPYTFRKSRYIAVIALLKFSCLLCVDSVHSWWPWLDSPWGRCV